MLLLTHLHPATVHFPIALLLVGSFLALVQVFRPVRVDLHGTSWLLLGLGWVSALAAVLTGLLAQSGLPPDAPYRSVLNWHIGTGMGLVVLYGYVLYRGWLYRSARARAQRARAGRNIHDLLDDPSARPWLAFMLFLCMLLIVASGWNGGSLVYEWGVNIQ
jgi:uncharacterized membrane protein